MGEEKADSTQEWPSPNPEAGNWYDDELRKHRRGVAWIAGSGLVGLLATMAMVLPFPEYSFLELAFSSGILQIIALSSLAGCSFGAVMMYLQTGFRAPRRPSEDAALQAARAESEEFDNFRREMVGRVESLEAASALPFAEIDEELVQRVRERIDEKATEEYLEGLRLAVRAEESQRRRTEARSRLETTIERLRKERDALTRRGNLNLAAGSFVAIGGMGMLAYFLVATTSSTLPDANGWDFVRRFLPQLSLVTIVEVFAYFFLRLYSRSLTEIKYFQNEISNVEAKLASLGTALETGDRELVGDVVRELARTERNHILKKGETAVAGDQR